MSEAPHSVEPPIGGPPPVESPQQLRDLIESSIPILTANLPEVGAFHEAVCFREVDGTKVTADVVVPKGPGPHPVLVYLHGGAWVAGSAHSHRKVGFRFAEAGWLVFNVDYRLAPEAPFPAAFEDCVAAVRWAATVASEYGGDADRLAIGGDSAGANLSAAVAVALAADPDAPAIKAALLIYGVFDMSTMGTSGQAEGPAHFYLGRDAAGLLQDPRVSPLLGAAQLPPCYVVVGSTDDLVPQSAQLAAALQSAGVDHEHVVVEGMPHGFVQAEDFFPEARRTFDEMVAFISRHTS